MLEKNKSKRPFVIDLFKYFPLNHYKIRNDIDMENYEAYQQFKEVMEKKRAIDGNKIEIHTQFETLKRRLQS